VSIERVKCESGVVWRVRWRDNGKPRSRVLGSRRYAPAQSGAHAVARAQCSARAVMSWIMSVFVVAYWFVWTQARVASYIFTVL
jgi:hypothetical protein